MSQLIQSLERRVLMSVTATTLATDLSNVQAAITAGETTHTNRYDFAKSAIETISADVKGLTTKSNRASEEHLVLELVAAGDTSHAKLVVDLSVLKVLSTVLSKVGVAAGDSLIKHPTSVALQKLVTRDAALLNATIPIKVTNLDDELNSSSATLEADLNAIATANPSLASTISSDITTLATDTTALETAAGQLQTATTQLATDLTSLAG